MAYLKNCWYVAAMAHEISRKPIVRTFLDQPVLLFRTLAGAAVAMSNRCPHRFAPLHQGKLVDDVIQCPYHGLQFDSSGSCVYYPFGKGSVPTNGRVRTFPIIERHTVLWIWMGEPVDADPTLIPDFSALERHDLAYATIYIHAQANYELIVDNLLDLSHVEFLHPLLASPGWKDRVEQTVRQNGEVVTSTYRSDNDPCLPVFKFLKPTLPEVGSMVQEERWEPPSHMLLSFRYMGEKESLWVTGAHFVTPETDKSSHYMVISGHDYDIENRELAESFGRAVGSAFEKEDIPIIEAQQRQMPTTDLMSLHPMVLSGDGAAIRARRILAKRIKQEQASAGATDTANAMGG